MARVAAAALAGEDKTFTGADMSTKLKLLGVDVASFGDAQGRGGGHARHLVARRHQAKDFPLPQGAFTDGKHVRIGGEDKTFTGADMSTKLKLLGVDVASFGDAQGRTPGEGFIFARERGGGHARHLVARRHQAKDFPLPQGAFTAAAALAGEDKTFTGADMSTKLKLLGVDVASFGDAFFRRG
jgi:NAD(P)H-nitrite reductase large subunit